jgi:multidrug efflux pump subunit AcrA (membrane-fusion protein)
MGSVRRAPNERSGPRAFTPRPGPFAEQSGPRGFALRPGPFAARRGIGAAFLALVAAVSLTAAACSDNTGDIGVGTASQADVTEVVDAPASVTAKAVASLSAPADGTIASLSVTPGATVAAGQVLAVIDSPSAQRQLAQAADALRALSAGGGGGGRVDLSGTQRRTDQAAAAAFAQARDAASKITDPAVRAVLLAQIAAAERAYQEAAASARALIASVQRGLASVGQAMAALGAAQRTQAQAAFDLAKSTVDALTLRAPIPGVVQLGGSGSATPAAGSLTDLLGAVTGGGGAAPGGTASGGATSGSGGAPAGPGIDSAALTVGSRVSAGTPVVTVVDTSELGLVAEVDETDILLISPGISASVELDAAPTARYEATVRSIDVLPTSSSRGGVSYRVRLALAAGKLRDGRAAPTPRPGMSAVAHLAVRSATSVVVVPAAAVFTVDGHDAVWVVRDGKAVRVPVVVGVAGQDLVQVTSGVSTGDRIVVRGTDRVHDGQTLP